MKDLQRAVYLAVKDSDFRRRLIDDPKGAIESIGLRLGDDELEAIIELRKIFSIPPLKLASFLASIGKAGWIP
jgi:hypothetical protein